MNKTEFIKELMDRTGMDAKKAQASLKAMLDIIRDTLADDDIIQIVGFGTFAPVTKASRVGVNPRTGEKIEIPSKRVIKFTPGAKLKAAVN